MRNVIGWPFALLLALTVLGCGDKSTTNVSISGPFGACPILILPTGQRVDFSRATVNQDGTVTINGVTYTINNNCSTTEVAVVPPVPAVAP